MNVCISYVRSTCVYAYCVYRPHAYMCTYRTFLCICSIHIRMCTYVCTEYVCTYVHTYIQYICVYVFSNNNIIISSLLQALHQFINEYQLNSDEGENIDLAIQTVGEAQKEPLTKKLIEYLMGETDDCPKVWICTVYTYIRMYCMCVCR